MRRVVRFVVAIAIVGAVGAAVAPAAVAQDEEAPTVQLLNERIDALNQELDTARTLIFVLLGFGGLVSFASLGGFVRSEQRATESHKVAMQGERAGQQRSAEVHETFLESSRNTLDLVNATLTLAKEASERAAQTIQNKADATLDELDIAAKALVARVPADDDRALVADPVRRSELRSLAQKIAGFEINRFILPVNVGLTPHCMFIRGMDFHLSQQFDDAFECWRDVALREDGPSFLKSLAWYWIGYEFNNLGEFSEARHSFDRALELAGPGARQFELQRISIESRFFNKEPAEGLVEQLDRLLKSVHKEPSEEKLDVTRAKIQGTAGNVSHELGNELRRAGRIDDATTRYEQAKQFYLSISSIDKWARFGLAEAKWRLGELDEELYRNVRTAAIEEYVNREEPRTKVLARTTELVCCLRVPEFQDEVQSIHPQLVADVGRVDGRLTVYSQIQRRNVPKSEFRRDLEELLSESSSR